MENHPASEIALFRIAFSIQSDELREEYLQQVCGDNRKLRNRIADLLQANKEDSQFLESPPTCVGPALDYLPIAEHAGAIIGRYKLLEEIGEGGMGVVYRALQQEPVHREVALKIVKPGMDSKAVMARFEAERQALALMDHPNIAKVHDAGTAESGRPYFVMELVDGTPLTDYCDQQQLATRQRLELFAQVCLAVQHAHQKGIIHRDLKPSNVLVAIYDGAPVPKIIDFGIAKAVIPQPDKTAITTGLGLMMGTPLYMSPEQAGTSGLDVDTRSDIYSLGVMLYELLTGSTPFDKERARESGYDEIRRMIREEEPPRPSARISTLGEAAATVSMCRNTEPARLSRLVRGDLDWIVMRALDKDPARRYQTANDLAADLQRYLADEPIDARPPTLLDRAAKWSRRHRPLVWSAVALLVFFTFGSLISTLLIAGAYNEKNQQLKATEKAERLAKQQEGLAKEQERLAKEQHKLAEDQKEEAVKQRSISEGNLYIAHMRLAQRDWEQGQTSRLLDMLDRHFPESGQRDLRGWEWYYFLSLCHGEIATLVRSGGRALTVAWSPDGTRLATSGEDRRIRVWNAATRKEILTLSAGAACWQVAWSPDGKRLASAQTDNTARVWDLAARKTVFTFGGFNKDVVWVAWSPDGDRLAAGDWDGVIRVWDTVKGTQILNLKGAGPSVAWSADGKRLALSKAGADGYHHIQIVDALSGGEVLSFAATKVETLWDLAWSPNGKRLASSESENWVRVWDATTGQELLKFRHLGTVGRVAWSPDGKRLATASWAQRISVWDLATGRETLTLRGHRNHVAFVSWSPDGNQLASAGDDGMVKVWDVRGKQESPAMEGARAVALAWSPQGRRLAWAGGRKVTLWDPKRGSEVLLSNVDAQQVAWSPSGKHLAVGKPGGFVVLDVEAHREMRTFPCGDVDAISWSPDSTRLAVTVVTSGERLVVTRVWDVANGREVLSRSASKETNVNRMHALAWSPDGARVASAENGSVIVWDAATGKEMLAIPGNDGDNPIHAVAWSPDGTRLASGWSDESVKVWDSSTGRVLWTLEGHTGAVRAVSWSPDGKRLASASTDGTARVWDPGNGQELLSLPGSFAGWSSDGRGLATIDDADGAIRIWDTSSGYAFAGGADYQSEIGLARKRALEEQANIDAQSGATDKVIADCTEAIRLDPKYAGAYNIRGWAYARKGEYDKAIADCTEAIRLDPEFAGAYNERGVTYFYKHEYDKAIADCTEAIRLDPKSAVWRYNRGWAYLSKGEYDKAIIDYTEAIRLDPKVPPAYNQRGWAYVGKGEYDKAIADCTEAIRLDPKVPNPHKHRGFAYLSKGEYDKAIADCTEAIRLDPKYARAYYGRGQAYASKNDVGDALADFREGMRLDSPSSKPWLHWLFCWLPAVMRGTEKQPGIVFVSDMPWVKSTCGSGLSQAQRDRGLSSDPTRIADFLPYSKGIRTHAFDDARPADVVVEISKHKFTAFKADVSLQEHGSVKFQVLVDGKIRHETRVLHYGVVEPICVDVSGGKEVALRVLNGGGNNGGPVVWAHARFVQAGREDPLEEPREIRSGIDANAALLLAEVHWRLDHKDLARRWFDKASAWMEKNKTEAEKFRPVRAEAARVLGISEKPLPGKIDDKKP